MKRSGCSHARRLTARREPLGGSLALPTKTKRPMNLNSLLSRPSSQVNRWCKWEVNAMNHKMPKPPTTERRFANSWGELAYLCRKIRYWLYKRKQRARAEHYRNRLTMVLHDLPENDLAIIREEGLALFCELEDEVCEAIAHREREIQLIERLHRDAESPRYDERTRAYLLQNVDATALQERQA
jgi:hypothetical protein